MENEIYNGIMGLVVGDALGVPFEFKKRDSFICPGMTGYGTYDQPPGTWSDDSSMTLATLDSLIENKGKINLEDMMLKFMNWLYYDKYTPYNNVFDVGQTTRSAIWEYAYNGKSVYGCGERSVTNNGNGSLMRIFPLAFIDTNTKDVFNVSGLTHAHNLAKTACLIYVKIANNLVHGYDKEDAVSNALTECEWCMTEVFERLKYIKDFHRNAINSSGYVIHTLEAALWCFLTTDNYKDCVEEAVRLGNDTDTTAAVAGGLAGIYYGVGGDGIPEEWIEKIARKDWIKELCEKFENALNLV